MGVFHNRDKIMAKVTIDNREYETKDLSAEGVGHLLNLQFVEAELMRLQAKATVLQTARDVYADALMVAQLKSAIKT